MDESPLQWQDLKPVLLSVGVDIDKARSIWAELLITNVERHPDYEKGGIVTYRIVSPQSIAYRTIRQFHPIYESERLLKVLGIPTNIKIMRDHIVGKTVYGRIASRFTKDRTKGEVHIFDITHSDQEYAIFFTEEALLEIINHHCRDRFVSTVTICTQHLGLLSMHAMDEVENHLKALRDDGKLIGKEEAHYWVWKSVLSVPRIT